RSSAAEFAIEAAIPRPEPANVPPPTAADIKLETTATVQDTVPAKNSSNAEAAPAPLAVESKSSDVAPTPSAEAPHSETAKTEAPQTEPTKVEPAKSDTAAAPAAATAPAETPKYIAKQPATEPVKAASNVPAADQP